jgi:predicted dehydrogenase
MHRIRIGIIGCGTIAQIMHLPFLHELRDYFQIVAICDLSAKLIDYIGDKFGISARYTDYRELLARQDIDAVAILTIDHLQVALEAIHAGKHVFVEKPLAHNLEQADQIIEAASRHRVLLMVGYMKRYDPGFGRAMNYFKEMRNDAQLIRIHVLGAAREGKYPLQADGIYTVKEYDDVPTSVLNGLGRQVTDGLCQAIDSDDPVLLQAYRNLLLVCCHDSNIMRAAFGEPECVLFTNVYRQGHGIISVLQYPNESRCIWEVGGWLGPEGRRWWDESISAYGTHRTVTVVFPNTYLKYVPTMIYVSHSDREAVVKSEILTSYEEAFRREWLHFYDCVVNENEPLTNAKDARAYIALAIEMVKFFQY